MTQKRVICVRNCNKDYIRPICQESVDEGIMITLLPCGHGFHGKCIRKQVHISKPWSSLCSICRSEIPKEYLIRHRKNILRLDHLTLRLNNIMDNIDVMVLDRYFFAVALSFANQS